jgi:hypothetical protein
MHALVKLIRECPAGQALRAAVLRTKESAVDSLTTALALQSSPTTPRRRRATARVSCKYLAERLIVVVYQSKEYQLWVPINICPCKALSYVMAGISTVQASVMRSSNLSLSLSRNRTTSSGRSTFGSKCHHEHSQRRAWPCTPWYTCPHQDHYSW